MPLNAGIWEYDENDTVSPTYSEHLNKLGDSVRAMLAPNNGTGTWNAFAQSQFDTSTAVVERRGEMVTGYGFLLFKGAASVGSAGLTVGILTPPPAHPVYTTAPTERGIVELSVTTSGVMTLRNLSGTTLTFAANQFVGLSGLHYRTTEL